MDKIYSYCIDWALTKNYSPRRLKLLFRSTKCKWFSTISYIKISWCIKDVLEKNIGKKLIDEQDYISGV